MADTIKILEGLRSSYEDHHRVRFTDDALVSAANLADRYIADRFLPDKAIDLIDEAGSRMRLKRSDLPVEIKEIDERISGLRSDKREAVQAQQYERAIQLRDQEKALLLERAERAIDGGSPDDFSALISDDEIAEVLAQWTGIPVHRLTEEETSRLLNMETSCTSGSSASTTPSVPCRNRSGGPGLGSRTRSGPQGRSSSSDHRALVRRSPPSRWPTSFSVMRAL